MHTHAQVRKIKPLEKKAKYSDEKGAIKELLFISCENFLLNSVSVIIKLV
ncbi:hypothetical protein F991_03244 [Acinetobacter sp. CIP-A165]|nr:hypothetical protein F991_03244 [Acinetobacter sp. CIP-A165]